MSITRINSGLPATTKIDRLNTMILELNGLVAQGKFDINELDQLYSGLSAGRKFTRNVAIGNTTSTYTGWSHVYAESGYSIWKYTPTNYTYNALNQLYMADVVLENRGSASSETATTFDSVLLYNGDSGSGYVNNTTESGTVTGTGFDVMNTTLDYFYVGSSATFGGVKFNWKTRGSNYTVVAQYWNGVDWATLSLETDNLEDATSDFQSDGHISWTIPSGWATASVNSSTKYWVRFSTTTNPITVASAYYVIPSSSVIGLLALSSAEALAESWAWCSYNGSIYVTIPNQGASTYEGISYITSSSSTANLQNYFVYNEPFTADYQDSSWAGYHSIVGAGYVIDGGGSVPATGIIGDIQIPFDCTILSVTLLADQVGSITLDIWKDTYTNYPPTVADTIVAASKPTITAASKSLDSTLSGWTTSITAGDILRINLDSVTSISRCSVILKLGRT